MVKRKNNKNVLIYLFFYFIFIHYAANNSYCQEIIDSTFYPLQIGNRWVYTYFIDTIELSISITGDTIMENGKKYFIVQKTAINKTRISYERIDSLGKTWLYDKDNLDNNIETSELMMEDFSLPLGQKFKSKRELLADTASILQSGYILSKYTKKRNKMVSVIYFVDHDEPLFNYFEMGIGITIYSLGIAGSLDLKWAIINGKYYDRFVNVEKYKNETHSNLLIFNNYPNPFNPETTIKYELKSSERIVLSICDILGRKIITLIDEYKRPGVYEIRWNGKDNNGNDTPSGIYLCRSYFGNDQAIRLLLKIK